jgi:hypothetical protein
MSEQDSLKLAAEIVDKFSGPLREMTKSVHSFQDMLKGAHAEGSKGAKEQAERQKALNEALRSTGEKLTGFVTPAMAALGLSVGGVGASIGALISKLKESGESFYKLQGAMMRTGMALPALEAIGRTLSEITSAPLDQSIAQIASLGDHIARLQRGQSTETAGFFQQFNNLPALLAKIKNETAAEAAKDFLKFVIDTPAPADQKRKFFEWAGIDPNLANAKPEQFNKTFEEKTKWVAENPPLDVKMLDSIKTAMSNLDSATERFSLTMEKAFGPNVVLLIERIAKVINKTVDAYHEYKKLVEPLTVPGGGGSKGSSGPGWVAKGLPGFQNESFIQGGSSDAEDILSHGVKTGTLEALREWAASLGSGKDGKGGGGGGGGFVNAAYSPGGGGGGGGGNDNTPIGRAVRAAKEAAAHNKGGGRRALSRHLGIDKPAPGGGSTDDGVGGGGSGSDAGGPWDKSRFRAEIANTPGLKEKIFQLAAGEDRPSGGESLRANEAVMDTMMNRAIMRHTTLAAQAKWTRGRYGDSNGYYDGNPSRLSAAEHANSEANLERAFGRSITDHGTDNSSGGLAEREAGSGKFIRHKKIHGESFFRPGWAEPGFRDEWARLDKKDRSLLASARGAGMGGNGQKITGGADLNVNFSNAPPGTSSWMKTHGIFADGNSGTDWGTSMPTSSPGRR